MAVIEVVPVPYDMLRHWAGIAWRFLDRAIQRSPSWTGDELREVLEGRKALLWVVFINRHAVGAVVTEIIGKQAWVSLLGGERFHEWRSGVSTIEAWAREAGCAELCFDGRRGWARVMAVDGFVSNGDRVSKVLHG